MSDINSMSPKSGRVLKENGTTINTADILAAVYDAINGVLKTSANITVGDIEIGAVELKDSTTETRAVITSNGLVVDVKATENSTIEKASLGQYGSKRITDTNATTPTINFVFTTIYVTEDAVIATLVGNMTNSTNITLIAGQTLYGRFTSITLTSGKVIAYMGV